MKKYDGSRVKDRMPTGGVNVIRGTFTVSGRISGNHAELYGGGVYAQEFGNFRMADGIIYGSDAVAGLANTLIDENSGLGAAFRGLFAKRCQRVGFL